MNKVFIILENMNKMNKNEFIEFISFYEKELNCMPYYTLFKQFHIIVEFFSIINSIDESHLKLINIADRNRLLNVEKQYKDILQYNIKVCHDNLINNITNINKKEKERKLEDLSKEELIEIIRNKK